MSRLNDAWYKRSRSLKLLRPLSLFFGAVVRLRHWLYSGGRKFIYRARCPLLVVGNISVGGTGKTPLVIYLAERLKAAGYRPGIVSRGYGSKAPGYPFHVKAGSPVEYSGDEALLIARRTGCPVVIGADRVAAVKSLEMHDSPDVIISDDGLQHYAMGRDLEIVVVDSGRGFGNGRLLPEGPLRETIERLDSVDCVVFNGPVTREMPQPSFAMTVKPAALYHLKSGQDYPVEYLSERNAVIDEKTGRQERHKVHAVAGIGNPERFFSSLCACGFDIITHVFADHHKFTAADLEFGDGHEVVMTEKDAVKCRDFAADNHWYLKVEADLDDAFLTMVLERLDKTAHGNGNSHDAR